jgi:hypothetical protein
LELRWNRALERVTELEARIEKHVGETPATTPTSPEQFATLATDLKAIWRDPTADVRLKKRIVRELIREVIADLLAPIYGWFTEGFDTLDLKEAKVLLDELVQ